ncbi:MAG TPA: PQQ-dependent sugar dehydrogenase [Candidatus Dormibacteraeota bacterium]|nr:PQQ-dependent sugar dehydrogenase [Candidatus Dormibacteraeota bacterium]
MRVSTGRKLFPVYGLPFVLLAVAVSIAADNPFHDAPSSAKAMKNPYAGQQAAMDAGKTVYARNCLACHGKTLKGTGNVPSLVDGKLKGVTAGEIFWFITKGDKDNGMPSWASLPEEKRWQVVTYVDAVVSGKLVPGAATGAAPASAARTGELKDASPSAPFTDFRYEKPGTTRKITVSDLPKPFATESAENGAEETTRPENAWPVAPAGFKVELFASGLDNPRWLRTAPNGDIFLAESEPGRIRVFRGMTSDGKPEQSAIFASGLKRPYGIAFYPPGPEPQWVYVGDTNEVIRFPYHNGDLKASGESQHIADLPSGGGHWTRAIDFSADGKKMFVAVGSASNVDDTDTHPREKDRADILVCDPAHCELKVYAYGIRNPGGGIRVSAQTGELWCSVNERDALGDNLVPDYITHVQEGGFYGWPWWYIGAHQDPRHEGKHPELKDKAIVPDVLLQPHNASLEFTFYDGDKFPAEYKGDILASEHGSWNKAVRVGYEVIRVPLHQSGHATGEYEDFLTGFVLPDGKVWGRPVGITVAPDGSLLVSDDGSNSIWRVSYVGK